MSRATHQTSIVDVAVCVVVDKMSPVASAHEGDNCTPAATVSSRNAPRVLITRRKAEQVLGGYWELPGGKVEPDESPSDAAVRELHEEVGIEVKPIHALAPTDHRYDHAHVRLIPFVCEHIGGTPKPLHVDEVRWVAPNRLVGYPFPEASLPVIADFLRWLDSTAR